jgi:hypothetical protein
MARATAEAGGLEGWLYRMGYATARLENLLHHARESALDAADRVASIATDADPSEEFGQGDDADDLREQFGSLAATTAAGALVAQLVRPRSVNWPRAILAGTIGTLVYDAETVVESRFRQRKFGTSTAAPASDAYPGLSLQLTRYAAGIGMAGFYARYLYGRLPGSPLVQGLTFAMLESGTRAWGGPVALLQRFAPEVLVPSGYTRGIARDDETTFQRLRRHLLFGLVLGVVYRAKEKE